jgi:hypothetical protein
LAVLKTYKKLSKGVLLHHAGVEGVRMKQVILDIGTSCGEWSASHPGRAFPPGKDQRYPLVRRFGGLTAGLDKTATGNIVYLRRGSKPDRPVCSQAPY